MTAFMNFIAGFARDAVFGMLAFGLAVLVHEAGHLACAVAVGIPIARIQPGEGPQIYERTLGSVTFAIRLLPTGGQLDAAEGAGGTVNPWKVAMTHAAGPGANIIFAAVVFAFAGFAPGFWRGLMMFNLMIAFMALVFPWFGGDGIKAWKWIMRSQSNAGQ